ncbi:hypothetical protein V8E36_006649 [Tilletia maclaganii]
MSKSTAHTTPNSPASSSAAMSTATGISTRSRPVAPELSLPTRRRLIRKPLPGIPGTSSALSSTSDALHGPGGVAAMRERVRRAIETNKHEDERALNWWPDELPLLVLPEDNDDDDEDEERRQAKEAEHLLTTTCGLDDQSAAHLRTLLTYSIAYHPPNLSTPQHAQTRSQLAPALYLALLAALEHLSHPALVAALQRTAAMRWRAEQQLRAEAAAAAVAAAAAAAANSSGSGAGSSALLSRWARLGWSAAAGGARKSAAASAAAAAAAARSASTPITSPYVPSSLLGYSSAFHGPAARDEGLFGNGTEESSAEQEQRLRKRDVALKILSNAVWFARTYSTPGAFIMSGQQGGADGPPASSAGIGARHASAAAAIGGIHEGAPSRTSTPPPGAASQTGSILNPRTPAAATASVRGASNPAPITSATLSASRFLSTGRPSSSSSSSSSAITASGLATYIARSTPTTALSVHSSDSELGEGGEGSDTSSRRGSIIEHSGDTDSESGGDLSENEDGASEGGGDSAIRGDPTTPTKKKRNNTLAELGAAGESQTTPRLGSSSGFADGSERLAPSRTASGKTRQQPPPATFRSKAMEQLSSLSAAAGAAAAAIQAEQAKRRSRERSGGSSGSGSRTSSVPPPALAPLRSQSELSASTESTSTARPHGNLHRTSSNISSASSSARHSTHSEAEAAETALLEQAEREHRERVRKECEEWAKMVRCRICVRTVLPSEEDESVGAGKENDGTAREKDRTVTPKRPVSGGEAASSGNPERQRTASDFSQESTESGTSGSSERSAGSNASTRSDKTERGVQAAIPPRTSSSTGAGAMLDLRSLFAGYLGTDESAMSLPGHSLLSRAGLVSSAGGSVGEKKKATASSKSKSSAYGSADGGPFAGQRIRSPVIWKPDVFQGIDLFRSQNAPDIVRGSSAPESVYGSTRTSTTQDSTTGTTSLPDQAHEEEAQRVRVVGGTFFVRVQSEAEAVWVRRMLEVMLFAGCAMLLEAALLRDSGLGQSRTRKGQGAFARMGLSAAAAAAAGGGLGAAFADDVGGERTLRAKAALNGRGSLGRSSSLGGARRRSLSRRISDAAAAAAAVALNARDSALGASGTASSSSSAVSRLSSHLRRESSIASSKSGGDNGVSARHRTASVPSLVPVLQNGSSDAVGETGSSRGQKSSPSTPKSTTGSAAGGARGKRWSTKSLWSMIHTQQTGGVNSPGSGAEGPGSDADSVHQPAQEGHPHGIAGSSAASWMHRHNPLASTASSVRSGLSRSGSGRARAERVSADEDTQSTGGGTPSRSVRSSVDTESGSPRLHARRGSGGSGLRRAVTRDDGSAPATPNRTSGAQALKNSIGFPRTLSLRDPETGAAGSASPKEAPPASAASGLASAPHRLSGFGRMLKPFLMGSKGRADQNRIEEASPISETGGQGANLPERATPAPPPKELPPWPVVVLEDLRWPPPLTTSPEIAKMIQSLADGQDRGSTLGARNARTGATEERADSFLVPFSRRQAITVLVEGKSDVVTFAGTEGPAAIPIRPADAGTGKAESGPSTGGTGQAGPGVPEATSQTPGGLTPSTAARDGKSSSSSNTGTMSSTSGQSVASQASNLTSATAESQATNASAATAATGVSSKTTASTATTATSASSAPTAVTNPFFHLASAGVQRHREEVAFYARAGRSRDLPLGQLIEEMCIRATHAEAQLDELRALTNAAGGHSSAVGSGPGSGGGNSGEKAASGGGKLSSKETAKAAAEAASAISAGQVIHYLHGHHRIIVSSKVLPRSVLLKEQEQRLASGKKRCATDTEDGEGDETLVSELSVKDHEASDAADATRVHDRGFGGGTVNESDIAAVAAALHADPESARRAVLEASSALNLAENTDLDGEKAVVGDGTVLTRSIRPPQSGFGVWMWEADVKTGKQSKPRMMSEATYLLSFAKYLEALVYHPVLRSAKVDDVKGDEAGPSDDADITINSAAVRRVQERLRRGNAGQNGRLGQSKSTKSNTTAAQKAQQFDVARLFRVGRALVKICVRPVTVFELMLEGPVIGPGGKRFLPPKKLAITSSGGNSPAKNTHDPGRASFESARRIDIATGNAAEEKDDAQYDDPEQEEARLEIQRFFAGAKDIITRLEDILVERELDEKGFTIKRKPADGANADLAGAAADALSLLNRVKTGLRGDEFDLYDLLKDSPVDCLNDVRKGLQDRAKSAKNRLQAWVKKHLSAAEISKLGAFTYEEPWYAASSIHTFPGSRFIIREDEPLSIISFSLSSRDYRTELRSAGAKLEQSAHPVDKTTDVLQWRSGVADGSASGSAFSSSMSSSYSSRPDRDRVSRGGGPNGPGAGTGSGAGGTSGSGGAQQALDPDRDHVFYEPEPVAVRMKRKRRGRDTSILSLTLRRVGSSISASSGSGVPTPNNENGPAGSSNTAGGSGFMSSSFGGSSGADTSMDSTDDEPGAILGLGLGVSALDPTILDLTSTPARGSGAGGTRQRSQNESSTPTASIISSVAPGGGLLGGLTPGTSTALSAAGTSSTTTFKAQVTQVSGRPASLASIFTKDSASGTGTVDSGAAADTSMSVCSSASTASISDRTEGERRLGREGVAPDAQGGGAEGNATSPGSAQIAAASTTAMQTPTSSSLAASGLNALWSMSSPFQSFKGGRQQPTALVGSTLSPRAFSDAASARSSLSHAQDGLGAGSATQGGGGSNAPVASIPRAPAETPHLKHTVYHGNTKVSCVAWFAEEFAALRSKWGIGDDFLESLSRCNTWNAAGGKSKAQFFKTADDRFVAKQLLNVWNLDEMEAFLAFSPAYLRYAHNSVVNHCPSLLVKILGCYSIKIKHGDSVKLKMTLQVVENLFAGDEDERCGLVRYDLKGIRERKVKTSGASSGAHANGGAGADRDGGAGEKAGQPPVWWDHEWIENCRPRAFVPESQRELFLTALRNDLAFLTESNVMDYSLLVGMYEPDVTSAELSQDLALAEEEEMGGDGDAEAELGDEGDASGGGGDEDLAAGEEDNVLGPRRRRGARRKRCRQPMIRARIVDYIGAFTLVSSVMSSKGHTIRSIRQLLTMPSPSPKQAKQLESSSKKALKSGPEAKSNVTILPPSEYAERFGAAMVSAFTGCPDRTGVSELASSSSFLGASGVHSGGGGPAHLPAVL